MSGLGDLLGEAPAADFIILSTLKSPGRATLRNAGSPRDWDIRKGYGFSGASSVFTGNSLAKFECDIALWTPAHWLDWKLFAKLLEKPAGGSLIPLTGIGIYHPQLALAPLGISSVVVEDVLQFEQDDEGLWTCTIKFLEFKRPLPALGKPIASIPATSKAPPNAQDAISKEIAAKTAVFASLAAGGT